MLNINLITVGKLKENYWRDAVAEYSKRLSKFCSLKIIELSDKRLSENPGEKEIAAALFDEGKSIAPFIDAKSTFSFAMCIEGKQLSSEELARQLSLIPNSGVSTVNFIIGSSFGLDQSIKDKSDFKLSITKMTLPHQLCRVVLLEQIYRAFQINSNGKYHK